MNLSSFARSLVMRIQLSFFLLITLFLSSCLGFENPLWHEDLKIVSGGFNKGDLISAAGALYDEATDSFSSGSFAVVVVNDERNATQDLVCRYSAKYTTNNVLEYPYIQVYYNNPPLNSERFRMRYKIGEIGELRYGECKCITNGKTTGFSKSGWSGDYVVKITIPKGVTLSIDSFYAEYDNSFINKDSYRIMQHGRLFNASMDCETNWRGWSHVGNYGAVVVPKRTVDGVWVCFHDDTFGENPVVRVIGKSSASLPAESIQTCTYAQTQTLEYITENSYGFHDKIPRLEEFLEYCVKTDVHPVFSIHPKWTAEQWEEIKALVAKYNLLDKLNIKGGYGTNFIDTIFSVFGSDIESFLIDLALEKQPTSDQIRYLASKNWDKSKITVGFEYMSNSGGYFSDAKIELLRENGLVHGLYYIATDSHPLNTVFIKDCINKGCYELCADYFFSNGLNW